MFTAVFADLGSIYPTVRARFNNRIDYGKILNEHSQDEIIAAVAYGIQKPEDAIGFVDALTHLGFQTKFREAYDWHVQLCLDTIRILTKIQRFILISDDQHYVPLISMVHAQGIETVIYALDSMEAFKITNSKIIEIGKRILESGYAH